MTVHPLNSESPRCPQPSKVTHLDGVFFVKKKVEKVPFSASELHVHRVLETWEPQHFCKVAPYKK